MNLVPVVYSKCKCTVNIVGGAESDPEGKLLAEYQATGKAPIVDWNEGVCWNHGTRFKTHYGVIHPIER